MKKIFACAATLSLMLIACGGDSSANASNKEPALATLNNAAANSAFVNSDAVKTAVANTGPCSMNNAYAGNKAYLTNTENDGYQIVIPDMDVDIEYHNDEVQIERVRDTLRILPDSDPLSSLNWICYAYYTFNIPASEKDIKYFNFYGNVFEVVPGPAPEKAPDTL